MAEPTDRDGDAGQRGVSISSPLTRAFWLSWYWPISDGPFTLYRPWWISGERGNDEAKTVCAAVIAVSEDAAKELIRQSYDIPPVSIEWRFCEAQSDGWMPFNDRFPRGDWMRWPESECDGDAGLRRG